MSWNLNVTYYYGMKMWLHFMGWICGWTSLYENVTEFHVRKMWLNSVDGNSDCTRIVVAFCESNIASEFHKMYIDWKSWDDGANQSHRLKRWLNFVWWNSDLISWDKNVTQFMGKNCDSRNGNLNEFLRMKVWLNSRNEKVTAIHGMKFE